MVIDREDIETCESLITFQEFIVREFLKSGKLVKKMTEVGIREVEHDLLSFKRKANLLKKHIAIELKTPTTCRKKAKR
ncbi:hypothetical protein KEJ32_02660 [Candidatus Bathyarchaeota archaeon]|nr:hypothetical protein [Candidatus Bathyarchaeota archaeon]